VINSLIAIRAAQMTTLTNLSSSPWTIWMHRQQNAQFRLFCFPYSGGNSSFYRGWENYFPSQIDIGAVEYPGRNNRIEEKPYTQLSSLVTILLKELHNYFLEIPFAFFGHSLGGIVSFEIAQKLVHYDVFPSALFISACEAPQEINSVDKISKLAEREFVEKLRKFGNTPEEILQNEELIRLLLPTMRADFELAESYIYEVNPPLDIPIYVLGGIDDEIVSPQKLQGWSTHTTATFETHLFPGGHFFVRDNLTLVSKIICQKIHKFEGYF